MYAAYAPWFIFRWRPTALMLALIVGHAVIFYVVAHSHARGTISGGLSIFGPVISEVWQPPRHGLMARWEPQPEAPLVRPPDHWRFPPIDLWPSPPGFSAAPSGFTPVTDAEADPPAALVSPDQERGHVAPVRHPHLRMTRWLRPQYSPD